MNIFKLFFTSLLIISSTARAMQNNPLNEMDINAKDKKGRTALMRTLILEANAFAKMNQLVAQGAIVTLEDNEGKTALNYAAKKDRLSMQIFNRNDARCCEFLMERMLTIPTNEFKELTITLLCCLKRMKFPRDLRGLLATHMRQLLEENPEFSFAFGAIKKLPNGEVKSYLQRKYFPDSNIYPVIPKTKKKKRRTDE